MRDWRMIPLREPEAEYGLAMSLLKMGYLAFFWSFETWGLPNESKLEELAAEADGVSWMDTPRFPDMHQGTTTFGA